MTTIALSMPGKSQLTGLITAAVALLLIFLLLRHLVRKRGGWRRCWRRLGQELALTRRAFGEPYRAFRRHRRGVRTLAGQLAEPRNGLLVRRLLDSAAADLAEAPGAVAYALRRAPGTAAVQIAARRLPEPPAPWRPATGPGPQRWELPLAEDGTLPAAKPRPDGSVRPLPVALGMAEDGCVHLDLAAGPRMVTVEGDQAARLRLLQALAAQLDRPGSGASVTVTDGVHPHHHGPRLDTVLRRLEQEPPTPGEDSAHAAVTTVLVCATPDEPQARRLGALAADRAVLCLADGPVAGSSWTLRVTARGRVTAPELGLDADSGPLGRAVAATVRADQRRADGPGPRFGRRPAAAAPEPEQKEPGAEPAPAVTTAGAVLAEPASTKGSASAASSRAREKD